MTVRGGEGDGADQEVPGRGGRSKVGWCLQKRQKMGQAERAQSGGEEDEEVLPGGLVPILKTEGDVVRGSPAKMAAGWSAMPPPPTYLIC